jgi:DNA gyrase subunit B
LGCGIGKDEYDLTKLRYHRIILMTDADVDGSHIRTLLLTFFYRHLPELIEKGHLYIAQPPLYKLKKGKQERYIKDESELSAYLLELALDGTQLHVNAEAPALSGTAVEQLSRDYLQITVLMQRHSRIIPEPILLALMDLPVFSAEQLLDASATHAFAERLRGLLENGILQGDRQIAIHIAPVDAGHSHSLELTLVTHSISHSCTLGRGFFASSEYRRLVEMGDKIRDLLEPGAYVQRGDKKHSVRHFREAMDWLFGEARSGLNVQRYKGLGEMNPAQLWDTTMNAETRRMLQVRVEDAIAADEIFTTLMGDQVEPRREFIESNALSVLNLDT